MKTISVKNLSRSYTYSEIETGFWNSFKSLFYKKKCEKFALSDFSIEIKEGEFIGLIGPNGAGKTTLIKILTGIIQPSKGEINVLGHNPAKLTNEYKKEYALVMAQKSQLWWDLPAMDTFLLNKEIYQISDEKFKNNLNYLTNLFEVEDLLNIQVRKLSLGQRMKMELISCLLHDPKILFLDEPTIGLDVIAQKQMRVFLKKLNQEKKVTIILTSHYLEDIKHLCNRVVIINQGNKLYDGSFGNVMKQYSDKKIVNIVFDDPLDATIEFPMEIIQRDEFKLSGRVERDKINGILLNMLNNFNVQDINIQEEDISDIIEKIYRGNKVIQNEIVS